FGTDGVEDKLASLQIVNSVSDELYYISYVKLIGYDFSSLRVTSGKSQTFLLDKGMSGGTNNINVIVGYKTDYRPANKKEIAVNFKVGETTIISLNGCASFEGCDGHYLSTPN